MACYAGTEAQAAVCVSDGSRPPYPIVLDPLDARADGLEFDLIGRRLSRRQALTESGQSEWMIDSLQLLSEHSVAVGLLVPLLVPLLHYGIRLAGKCKNAAYSLSDTYRILMSPRLRRLFGLPVDASLDPAYTMYVYSCDLLDVSTPEVEEFFDPQNHRQFLNLLAVINPLGFTFADNGRRLANDGEGKRQRKSEAGVKKDSVQVKEESVQVKENSVQVKENSVQVKEDSDQVKEDSDQVKKDSDQVKEDSGEEGEGGLRSQERFQVKEDPVHVKEDSVHVKEDSVHVKEDSVHVKEDSVHVKEDSSENGFR